jgi:hypothetical protein
MPFDFPRSIGLITRVAPDWAYEEYRIKYSKYNKVRRSERYGL